MHKGNEKLTFMAYLGNGEYICLAGEKRGAQSAGVRDKVYKIRKRMERVLKPA